MAKTLLQGLRRVSLSSVLCFANPFRQILGAPVPSFILSMTLSHLPLDPKNCWLVVPQLQRRSLSHGSVNLVISPEGKPKFETHEIDPPKKEKWKTKKRLKLQRKREKQVRKAANKRDPRWLVVKGMKKRQRFSDAEERIKYKLENARIKENLLIERLKRYEVSKAQGPVVEPCVLSGEERFYMKKMAQKSSNYCPVGRRGVFGGVILNMHMHWKKHETVKVICKPCQPGQVQEYADEIARLSGGIPIQIIADDTIVFYRGKNYVQPKVMSPVDTLSKKRALEKSKYQQSLDSVRLFIAIAEKELELYYRHVALYGDPNNRDLTSIVNQPRRKDERNINGMTKTSNSAVGDGLERHSSAVSGFVDQELSEIEVINIDNNESSDYEDDELLNEDLDSSDEIVGTEKSIKIENVLG